MKSLRNDRGNVLLQGLAALVLFTVLTGSTLGVIKNINEKQVQQSSSFEVTLLESKLRPYLINETTCSLLAARVAKSDQEIKLIPSLLYSPDSTTLNPEWAHFSSISLVVKNPVVDNTYAHGGTVYRGDLVLKAQRKSSFGLTSVKDREMGNIYVELDGSGTMKSCFSTPSAERLCRHAGGSYASSSRVCTVIVRQTVYQKRPAPVPSGGGGGGGGCSSYSGVEAAVCQSIYVGQLDRMPDPEGLAYWTAQVSSGNMSLNQAVDVTRTGQVEAIAVQLNGGQTVINSNNSSSAFSAWSHAASLQGALTYSGVDSQTAAQIGGQQLYEALILGR